MKREHGSNKWWVGDISMLEIASTQGLLDHDTSQAVLIIWTAPSAPLIFYPQQFIWSSVCTHTAHFTKKLSPQSPCGEELLHGLPWWFRDRVKARVRVSQLEQTGWGISPGTAVKACRRGGGGDMCRAPRLLYRVPLRCLIESMSPLSAGWKPTIHPHHKVWLIQK